MSRRTATGVRKAQVVNSTEQQLGNNWSYSNFSSTLLLVVLLVLAFGLTLGLSGLAGTAVGTAEDLEGAYSYYRCCWLANARR